MLLLVAFAFPVSGVAQDAEFDCARNLAAEYQKTSEGNLHLAQSGLYSAYVRSLTEQMTKLTDGVIEPLASTELIFLDDELVRLQKQRLSLLGEFAATHRDKLLSGRHCEVAADFPPVLSQATAMDAAYATRFNTIIAERLVELQKPAASPPQPVAAQDADPDCGQALEQQLKSTYMMGETGTLYQTYRRLGADCVDANRCGEIENLVIARQLSLDDELLRLRKQRLLLFHEFAVRNRANFGHDNCAAVADFSSISGEIKTLLDAFMVRANALREVRLAAIPQGAGTPACPEPHNPYSDEVEQHAGFKWAQRTGGSCGQNSVFFNEGCAEYQRQQSAFVQCKARE